MSSGESYDREALFSQLEKLATEQRNPDTMGIDLASAQEIVRLINREDRRVAECVGERLPEIAKAVEMAAHAIRNGGRILYFGAGTSGRLGILDAAECPPTFGTEPETVQGFIAGGKGAVFQAVEGAEDLEQNGVDEVRNAGVVSGDLVCGLAASGRTPYVHGVISEAKQIGCQTLFITTVPASQIDIEVDLMIDIPVGPEVIMGSTRMKSATAQKLVLNMISTGAMIRLGKVYENVMVDLQLSNNKLKERAKRIVMFLAGKRYDEAETLLNKADGHVKTALMMAFTGLGPDACRELLADADGFIRMALEKGRYKK